MEETKRILVENSHLPMSIILVGVGQGDMSDMNILDDDQRTMSFNGVKAQRDIVQFVREYSFLIARTLVSRTVTFLPVAEMSQYLPDGCLDPSTFHSVMEGANAKYHLAKVGIKDNHGLGYFNY